MNTLNTRYSPKVYCVGGRMYRTVVLTPTRLCLEDLLDGQCLSFTRDEAQQMIQQQDLVRVKRSAFWFLCQDDPRYRRHLPDWPLHDDRKPWTKTTAQRATGMPCPSITPRGAPADSAPWRKGAAERQYRCELLAQCRHKGLSERPLGLVQSVVIMDELSRCRGYQPMTLAEHLPNSLKPKRLVRQPEDIQQLILREVQSSYLIRGMPGQSLAKHIACQIVGVNILRPPKEQLKLPSMTTLHRLIRELRKQLKHPL